MSTMNLISNITRIRELNDAFRRDPIRHGKLMMTRGVAALPIFHQLAIIAKVKTFSDFTNDNDPDGEHNFGMIEFGGDKIFWKIDYYDRDCEYGSEDPADPAMTTRILTVMLASEY